MTIVLRIKSYLDFIFKIKLELEVPKSLSRYTYPMGNCQRWSLIQAIYRDPTLIFLWNCEARRTLPTCNYQLTSWPVSWKKIHSENSYFLQNHVFETPLPTKWNKIGGWNFERTEIYECSICSKNFKSLQHSIRKLYSSKLTQTWSFSAILTDSWNFNGTRFQDENSMTSSSTRVVCMHKFLAHSMKPIPRYSHVKMSPNESGHLGVIP